MSNGRSNSHRWWDETELIQVLETLPNYSECGTLVTFMTANGGMRLKVTLEVHAPWVGIDLFAGESDASVFSVDCWYEQCERKEDKSAEWLDFRRCRLQSGAEPAFDLRAAVQPNIRVQILE